MAGSQIKVTQELSDLLSVRSYLLGLLLCRPYRDENHVINMASTGKGSVTESSIVDRQNWNMKYGIY